MLNKGDYNKCSLHLIKIINILSQVRLRCIEIDIKSNDVNLRIRFIA